LPQADGQIVARAVHAGFKVPSVGNRLVKTIRLTEEELLMIKERIPVRQPHDARALVLFQLQDASAPVAEIAELLTSELVTNAIVHGHDHATLGVEVTADRVHVEVSDSDTTADLKPLYVPTSRTHGRGLMLVDRLASSWGVEAHPGGKVVWFELAFNVSRGK
jgi:anti-sigma regulatory factor (Ser/Thr protein kinase)